MLAQPPAYGLSGTTTGPGEPAGARWMWAARMGSTFWTEIFQQTVSVPGLIQILAVPVAFGSPDTGTSLGPASEVVNGRPLAAADPANVRAIAKLEVRAIASARRRRSWVMKFLHLQDAPA